MHKEYLISSTEKVGSRWDTLAHLAKLNCRNLKHLDPVLDGFYMLLVEKESPNSSKRAHSRTTSFLVFVPTTPFQHRIKSHLGTMGEIVSDSPMPASHLCPVPTSSTSQCPHVAASSLPAFAPPRPSPVSRSSSTSSLPLLVRLDRRLTIAASRDLAWPHPPNYPRNQWILLVLPGVDPLLLQWRRG